ncbi:putative UDP-glucose lipid carrier transferase [Citrobacter koseri]|uniref:Putative UDP-glucose lipid carrier transferase n=1 Tax=Citrobacter koseri TaxID=545 RepID=A0A2X2VE55_CITKO|nr:putative UDP-glucose lipid carrier transferase [Citrobacter koseri]
MTNLKKRERAKTNASLISMVQRFSDITIMFGGLWVVCKLSGLPFLYMHLLGGADHAGGFSDAGRHN